MEENVNYWTKFAENFPDGQYSDICKQRIKKVRMWNSKGVAEWLDTDNKGFKTLATHFASLPFSSLRVTSGQKDRADFNVVGKVEKPWNTISQMLRIVPKERNTTKQF